MSTNENKVRRPRGFAAMDPARLKEFASRGGKAAHAMGKAYQWNAETASVAGRKGGLAVHAKKRSSKLAESNNNDDVVVDTANAE